MYSLLTYLLTYREREDTASNIAVVAVADVAADATTVAAAVWMEQ